MNHKLLLFDIDGTLISARDLPKKAMANVLRRRYPTFKYNQTYDFSGRTDPEIIESLLQYGQQPVSESIITAILDDFCDEMEKEFRNGQKPLIHPGVNELLSKLFQLDDVFLALVTGNVARGARIKLESAGLTDYFPVGGFGDDSKNRDDLPPIAQKRAQDYYQQYFQPENIWIIGDSIHDISCAKANDLRCLAVSTGWTSYENLAAQNPEYLTQDLSDVEKIHDLLTS